MSVFRLLCVRRLVEHLADLLQPLFHATARPPPRSSCSPPAYGSPSTRCPGPSARGQKARTKLAPRIAELRKKHAQEPREAAEGGPELHAEEKVSPLSGCLPRLLQLPAFFLMYHLFSTTRSAAEPTVCSATRCSPRRSAGRWTDALSDGGLLGAAGLVYVALFAIVAGVATFNYRRDEAA